MRCKPSRASKLAEALRERMAKVEYARVSVLTDAGQYDVVYDASAPHQPFKVTAAWGVVRALPWPREDWPRIRAAIDALYNMQDR